MPSRPHLSTDPAGRFVRLVRWARLVLWCERLIERGWPLVGLVFLFTALAALEVPSRLPGWAHAGLLALFLGGLAVSLWRFRRLRPPTVQQAHRRIEEDSGLSHRPLALLEDELSAGKGDPLATTLWQLQRKRVAALSPSFRLGGPRPVLPKADPLGLRVIPLLLLAFAFAGGRLDSALPDRLSAALSPRLEGLGGPPPTLQVWATPPAYTHLPPQLLQPRQGRVTLPAGSRILAQLQGGHGRAEARLEGESHDFTQEGPDSQKVEFAITQGDRLDIRQGFFSIASWPLAVIGDQPPTVTLAGPPGKDRIGRLRLDIQGHDDYGIVKLWLLLRPSDDPRAQPQALELPVDADAGPDLKSVLWQDLTGHPWAGRTVSLSLAAEDGAGQKGLSDPITVILPERNFTNPVAAAVIAQRRRLALAPSDRSPVMAGLARIASDINSFHGDYTVFLALSVSISRLRWDSSDQAVPSVLDILWQTALRLEEGDKPMTQKALAEVQKALQQALAENAPPAEIARLMAELQTVLDQYLDAMVQDALRHGLNGMPVNPDQPTVNPQDLQDMVEQIKDLASTGSREAAQAMLKRLRQLTDGLQSSAKMPSEQQVRQAQSLMGELNTITNEENALLDQTFQQNRRQQADDDRDGLPILGERQSRSGQSSGGNTPPQATARQDALRARLGQAMRKLGETGADIPLAFGQAERAMRDSAKALAENDLPDAVDAQTEAVARLQEGARKTLQDLSQRLGGGMTGPQGAPSNADPLGRPMQNGGMPNLSDQPLPSQSDQKKAREVLDELRRRSGEAQRPPEERDYLQRLLKSFF
ncbi:MAG TPA: TIGR02302 family protein [Candidatus Sulfotelmatobacter sp.]|jgi:uncharacterized protein (TIGR02302 family)|nr:TIGR02302 family protein [Candidatus Sulfotelmatobacter sp.]